MLTSRNVRQHQIEAEEEEEIVSEEVPGTEEDTPHTYYSSTNYDKFSMIYFNRPIEEKRVVEIVKDIDSGKDLLFAYPGIVGPGFVVTDGQHRHEAARRTRKPFFYIWAAGIQLQDAIRANDLTKGWGIRQYLDSFSDRGFVDYRMLQEFMKEYDWMPLMVSINSCSSSGYQRIPFKNGHYKADRMKFARDIAKMTLDFQPHFPQFGMRDFVATVRNLASNPEYDHKRMIRKMKYRGNDLKRRSTVEQYLENLTEIYNYREAPQHRVFLTEHFRRHPKGELDEKG